MPAAPVRPLKGGSPRRTPLRACAPPPYAVPWRQPSRVLVLGLQPVCGFRACAPSRETRCSEAASGASAGFSLRPGDARESPLGHAVLSYNRKMKSRAAAKARRHLFLAAVCLLSALLVVPTAEASRSLPAALAPVIESPAMPDLVLGESDAETQPRHRLFGDLSLLERPLDVVPIQKTASGVFALGIQSNIRQTGGLEQNRSGPYFPGPLDRSGHWASPMRGTGGMTRGRRAG